MNTTLPQHLGRSTDFEPLITWTMPVPLEQLKAGLRATVENMDRRNALQNCIEQATTSISKLPPELVDMIMEFSFADLLEKHLRQWSIVYSCTAEIYDSRMLGTVFRFALHEPAIEARLRKDLEEVLAQGCQKCQCSFTWCTDCTACLDYTVELNDVSPRQGFFQSPVEQHMCYEDCIYDIKNPMDRHPDAKMIYDELWGRGSYQDAFNVFHRAWREMLDNDWVFSRQERDVLATYFGLSCWLQCKNSSSGTQETAALLIPHAVIAIDRQNHKARFENVKVRNATLLNITPLTEEQRFRFTRVLDRLRLTPCTKLERWDRECFSQIGLADGDWPQPVLLSEHWLEVMTRPDRR